MKKPSWLYRMKYNLEVTLIVATYCLSTALKFIYKKISSKIKCLMGFHCYYTEFINDNGKKVKITYGSHYVKGKKCMRCGKIIK